jgi:isopenicillin N synthase-like dioxygenase
MIRTTWLATRCSGRTSGRRLPGFSSVVDAYYDATFELGRALLRGFALALDQPADRFDAVLTKPPSQLRLIHYPHDPQATDKPGIGAHTDYELFTLLRSTAPGLEVMNESGVWIDAPPLPDAYVVNIGDMLELWTGGEFVATSHRVRKVSQERYSFPLFFAVDYHTASHRCRASEWLTPAPPSATPAERKAA